MSISLACRSCSGGVLLLVLAAAAPAAFAAAGESAPVRGARIEPVPGQAELGTIEIHGAAADAFDPAIWQSNQLHFQPDVRSPLLAPRLSGAFRNIYAPSIVEVPGGWRVFYGAWDGVPTGNDRIYSVFTPDFLDFGERRMEIDHGRFIHVCNVSAVRVKNSAFAMICTVYPDAKGLNKPAFFQGSVPVSGSGETGADAFSRGDCPLAWNGSPAPYAARLDDIVDVSGYPPYRDADINGINVLLHEQEAYRLYFGNWRAPGHVHRASASDGRRFRYEGPCLDSAHAVNDVKRLTSGNRTFYLMALHANGDRLWYALSTDGMRFDAERQLATALGPADRFIVAIGWVTKGNRLLGFLYGAGAVSELNRNRIFARWLQKRLIFVADDGRRFEPAGALGPDRQIIALPGAGPFRGRFEVLGDDGRTRLAEPIPMSVTPGGVYRLHLPR